MMMMRTADGARGDASAGPRRREGLRGRSRGAARAVLRGRGAGRAGQVYKARQPAYTGMIGLTRSVEGVRRDLIQFDADGRSMPSAEAPHVKLVLGGWAIPHPDKSTRGGEDAHFLGRDCMGVADGVGSWEDVGVDPGIYAKELMRGAADALAELVDDNAKPIDALRRAHARANDSAAVGSTTACVAYLEHGKNVVRVGNIGDCGLLTIRDGKCVWRMPSQQVRVVRQ